MEESPNRKYNPPSQHTDAGTDLVRRYSGSILVVSRDVTVSKSIGGHLRSLGAGVHYVWSLEGLEFYPLMQVEIAVVTEDAWTGHEAFGRPLDSLLGSFKKILVLTSGENSPYARHVGGDAVDNVEYLGDFSDLKLKLNQLVRRESNHNQSNEDGFRQ